MANDKDKCTEQIIVKVIKCVPFQLCPKCAGEGKIVRLNLDTSAYNTEEPCDVCFGAKVIPMAVIPDKS